MKQGKQIARFLADETGTGMVEYSLLLAFVMFIVIGLAHGFHISAAGVTSLTNANLGAAKDVLQ